MFSTYYNPSLFPLIKENYIKTEICDSIVDYVESNPSLYDNQDRKYAYWDGRVLDYKNVSDIKIRSYVQYISRVMFMSVNSLSLVPDALVPDTVDVVKWGKGDKLDPPHYDVCHPDGTANYTPWRHMTAMVYLNEDYENGQIFFPDFKLEYKPKKGSTVVFPSDENYLHGVREITKGTRYTISSFYTYDLSKAYKWNSEIQRGKGNYISPSPTKTFHKFV